MKTIKNRYSNWDTRTKKRLKNATLSDGYLKEFIRIEPNSLTIVAFSQKQIMGWVFILSVRGENIVSIFVNKRYRNRGIARCLIEMTLDIYPKITLCHWNFITKTFFRNLHDEYPKKIRVIDWTENVERYQKIIETL